MRKLSLALILIAAIFILGVIGVTIYRFYALRTSNVLTGSMMNTIVPGDRVFSRRLSGAVKRGRIVVFQYPDDSTYYVSRIVGLPNETIEVRETSVYINGRPLEEEKVMVEAGDFETNELKEISTEGKGPYRVYYTAGPEGEQVRMNQTPAEPGPYQIPPDSFFVLGDNRDNSADSRYRGPVPRKLIWGEVFMIYFSMTVDSDEIRSNRMFKRVQ